MQEVAVSVRWSAWIALLVAEVLLLSVRFDTGVLQGDRRWWAELLGHSAEALRLGGAVAAATLLVGAARWRGEMRRWSGPRNPPRRRWPLLLGHLAAFSLNGGDYKLDGEALTRLFQQGKLTFPTS